MAGGSGEASYGPPCVRKMQNYTERYTRSVRVYSS